jgi:hypothetical protein
LRSLARRDVEHNLTVAGFRFRSASWNPRGGYSRRTFATVWDLSGARARDT